MTRPTALVTGATRGIGRAIAEDLARTHDVVLVGRDQEALAAVAQHLEGASTLALDVGDASAVDAVTPPSGLDVLVHAAGVSVNGTVGEVSREDWRQVFEVNVFGVAHLTSRLLPALRAGGGTVVLVNSGAGLFSTPGNAVYSGSKFALRTFADCLREEEREHGVRVVSVHPGIVDTDMGRQVLERGDGGRPERMIKPSTIAAAVRVAVDAPPEAQYETISVRPTMDPKGD